jgi:hypothetical protein
MVVTDSDRDQPMDRSAFMESRHWSEDSYWTDGLDLFYRLRESGRQTITLDLAAIEEAAFQRDSVALKLMEAMVSVFETEDSESWRGAPRILMALLAHLSEVEPRGAERNRITANVDDQPQPGRSVLSSLQESIWSLGEELVSCSQTCEGVRHDSAAAVLPRCLALEGAERDGLGAVIVGLNPGRSRPSEQQFYLDRGCDYESVVAFWDSHSHGIRYNQRLKEFARDIGLNGPVLWTELAKCECKPDSSSLPPLQTLRRCSGLFLQRELDAVPSDWPLLGVGAAAFQALAFMCPDRTVLGVPHPTGSRGQFSRLRDGSTIRPEIVATIQRVLTGNERQALWLDASRVC